jgi:hypothetical protein
VAKQNTAYFYVHGEADLFWRAPKVGAGPSVGPNELLKDPTPVQFLGHTEKSPQPAYENTYKPVFSSRTGEVIPADKIFMGQDVKVAMKLQRFDYDAITALKAAPRYGRVTAPGTLTRLDVGLLHQRNGQGLELWIRHAFFGSLNSAAYPDLPVGTYFCNVDVAGTYPDNLNRDAAFVQVLFNANWVETPTGSLLCYTQDPAYFKNLPDPG